MIKRILSSIIMCIIVCTLFLLKTNGVIALTCLITGAIFYEILRIDKKSNLYLICFISIYLISTFILLIKHNPFIPYLTHYLIPVLFIYILVELWRKKTIIRNIFFNHIKMFLVLTMSSICILKLYSLNLKLFLILIIYISLTDTLSYFFGRKFGKKKLSSISPNKTVEGFIYSYILLSIGIIFLIKINIFPLIYSLFLFLIPPLSLLGDLHESLYKREKNIKNSSELIPGHGGFYDRFDSYIIALPCYYFFIL